MEHALQDPVVMRTTRIQFLVTHIDFLVVIDTPIFLWVGCYFVNLNLVITFISIHGWQKLVYFQGPRTTTKPSWATKVMVSVAQWFDILGEESNQSQIDYYAFFFS